MVNKDSTQSITRMITFLNGIIPLSLVILSFFIGFTFPLGYLIYGWVEILGLSTFVSVVPDVAHWFLFGISLVGAQETAHITITSLILIGSLLTLFGFIRSFQNNLNGEIKGRTLWLIGGVLTFPLGLLALYSYRKTRRKDQDMNIRERFVGELRKNKLPYLLIIPALIFMVFTYIIPILRGFYITFFGYPDISQFLKPVDYTQDPLLWTLHAVLGSLQNSDPVFIGLDNYLELFSITNRSTSFQNALNNNIYFVILFVPGVIIVSLALAVLLNNKLLKGGNSYTTIFYLPVITSVLVVSVVWLRVVFPVEGLLTMIFTSLAPIHDGFFFIMNIFTLGIIPANTISGNINWLADDKMIESVALMSIWRSVGFDVLILLAGLKSIPSSLYEAADIDGHGGWSKFRNITLPNLKGPLGVVIILELINGWQIFQEFYGLNLAQYGGEQSLAIYLVANFARPSVMTFASTVGYFIFGMTAFIGLLGRMDIKNSLKGFSLFSLLAILFSIPSNRTNVIPKSLGFTVQWITFDVLFLVLSFASLAYYIIYSLLKYKELENDRRDLKITGYFTLIVVPFYMLNGYNVITGGNAGSTDFNLFNLTIDSFYLGLIFLVIALLMILSYYITPYLKKYQITSFLFPVEDVEGV
ncbi:MAG: L-arabinose transport system permease protein AraP [Candidatus Heimdallarchaeota archaeon LC_3]|nr:MAG: L-arabinose transport system permease protein AraP [Candidatus Heimdallarchaeota archaeon LC_3]